MINGLSIESTVLMKRRFLFFCFAEIASNATYMVSIKTGIVCRQWPNYHAATTSVSKNTPLLHKGKYRCTTDSSLTGLDLAKQVNLLLSAAQGQRPKNY